MPLKIGIDVAVEVEATIGGTESVPLSCSSANDLYPRLYVHAWSGDMYCCLELSDTGWRMVWLPSFHAQLAVTDRFTVMFQYRLAVGCLDDSSTSYCKLDVMDIIGM